MKAWEPALGGFREHLVASDRAAATVETYVRNVRWLAAAYPADPWAVTSTELGAWLDAQSWSTETRRKVLLAIRAFYAWAVRRGLVEWAPVAGLPSAKPRKRGPRLLTFPEAWSDDVAGFEAWLRAGGRAEGTIAARRFHLLKLAEVCADPWRVDSTRLAVFLACPDWSPEYRRALRTTLREFYRWGVRAQRIAASPADELDPVMRPRTLPRPTPDEAVAAALELADDRVRLALMFAALTGLRRAEIARLHTRDVTARDILVIGKGGHHRRVPMHPVLWDEYSREMTRRQHGTCGSGWNASAKRSGNFVSESGYVFPSDQSPEPMTPAHLGKLISRVLPASWTAHTLRHRFATQAYADQRDLLTVQHLLGHVRPETTARYAAVPDAAAAGAVAAVRL
ncbi:tyrosine-type recombinase/integrase [Nocardioides marmorisolisilvae]|uniref:tyrosine-type recombinase/integrase n=1 Tax=Nocardioides marmorisolisilvae TaxID=1542737 RepID=UPI00161784E9|nr:site-specific integrase [Nocardioides marmorisolisilvae]